MLWSHFVGELPVSNTQQQIRILFADSAQLRSQLLLGALRRCRGFAVTSCAHDGDAVRHIVETSPFDVVVVACDRRTSSDSLALVRRLHLSHVQLATVLLVDHVERDLVANAFRAGARGIFCHAESDFRGLCKCIRRVFQGQVWANSQQLRYLLDSVAQVSSLRVVDAKGDHLLSDREQQVVGLVADGLSNRGIAEELRLSEHTIKKYMFNIFEKLGISTRVELVLYALNHGGLRQAEWVPGN